MVLFIFQKSHNDHLVWIIAIRPIYLSPQYNLSKLQLVQNAAARILTKSNGRVFLRGEHAPALIPSVHVPACCTQESCNNQIGLYDNMTGLKQVFI